MAHSVESFFSASPPRICLGTFSTVSEGSVGKGVVRSNVEKKAFDNCSFQVLGIDTIIAGKRTQFGNSKCMDSDGDFVAMENFVPLGSKEATWMFIYGTDKSKGIKGGGKTEAAMRVKSIAPDTRQLCFRNTGTFELPK